MWHQEDLLAYRVEPLLRRGARKPLRLPRNRGTAMPRPRSLSPAPPRTPQPNPTEVLPLWTSADSMNAQISFVSLSEI